jgi:hypothetical protein
MARFIRLKNRIIDLDAIQYAAYVPSGTKPPESQAPSSLHLVVGGVAVDLDQDDDADALWEVIADRLQVEWIDPNVSVTPTLPVL